MILPFTRSRGLVTVLAVTLTLGLAFLGCGTAPPGAGLTNGPRPESADEKPATRTDLPVDTSPAGGVDVGQLGDAETSGGSGARGAGGAPDQPQTDQADGDSVRATPPAIIESGPTKETAGAENPVE